MIGGVKLKIGDTLNLDISKRVSNEGEELTQRDPLKKEEKKKNGVIQLGNVDKKDIKESLEKQYSKSYKIVGIIERPSMAIEPYSAPGYTIITKLEDISKNSNIAVLYKDAKDYKNITTSIVGMQKEDGSYKYEHKINRDLLRFMGAGLSGSTMKTVYTVSAVIMGIVLVSSVFVIKNGFAISVTERLKQYGMLASIGTTKKQIKKSVYFEGLILGLIRNTYWYFIWNSCDIYPI